MAAVLSRFLWKYAHRAASTLSVLLLMAKLAEKNRSEARRRLRRHRASIWDCPAGCASGGPGSGKRTRRGTPDAGGRLATMTRLVEDRRFAGVRAVQASASDFGNAVGGAHARERGTRRERVSLPERVLPGNPQADGEDSVTSSRGSCAQLWRRVLPRQLERKYKNAAVPLDRLHSLRFSQASASPRAAANEVCRRFRVERWSCLTQRGGGGTVQS
jgi:hypothetical protein